MKTAKEIPSKTLKKMEKLGELERKVATLKNRLEGMEIRIGDLRNEPDVIIEREVKPNELALSMLKYFEGNVLEVPIDYLLQEFKRDYSIDEIYRARGALIRAGLVLLEGHGIHYLTESGRNFEHE